MNDDERGPTPGGSGHASFQEAPPGGFAPGPERTVVPRRRGPALGGSGRVPVEHGPTGPGGVGAQRTGASGRAPVERVLTQDPVATVRGGPEPVVRPP